MIEGKLLDHPNKVVELGELQDRIAGYIEARIKLAEIRSVTRLVVVLTSGSYDLQHPEHYRYLASAKALGDVLVVLVDSDEHVKNRKGNTRPILPFEVRATMLSYQSSVDFIVEHDGRDDLEFLKAIQPSVYVQSHATKEQSIEAKKPRFDVVERFGGINVAMPLDNKFGISTSEIIKKIK